MPIADCPDCTLNNVQINRQTKKTDGQTNTDGWMNVWMARRIDW